MRCACVLLVLVICVWGTSGQRVGEGDVSRLLTNRDYVNRQINCVLDKGSCDNIGRQLKQAIPEVLGRQCKSCSARQLDNARKVVNYIRSNYPGPWSQIEAKYGRAAF
nr:PREDICTED: ejaculatory bulb-specific protein 3-like [Bemisia tabaci]WUR09780.1 ejaculatory bulb protein 6 [Bemisia tabaci]